MLSMCLIFLNLLLQIGNRGHEVYPVVWLKIKDTLHQGLQITLLKKISLSKKITSPKFQIFPASCTFENSKEKYFLAYLQFSPLKSVFREIWVQGLPSWGPDASLDTHNQWSEVDNGVYGNYGLFNNMAMMAILT